MSHGVPQMGNIASVLTQMIAQALPHILFQSQTNCPIRPLDKSMEIHMIWMDVKIQHSL